MTNPKGRPIPCDICGRAFGYVRDGGLWVYQRHNGEWHGVRITPALLEEWLSGEYEWYSKNGVVYHNCGPYGQRRPCEYRGDGLWKCTLCGREWDVMKMERG